MSFPENKLFLPLQEAYKKFVKKVKEHLFRKLLDATKFIVKEDILKFVKLFAKIILLKKKEF